MPSTSVVELEVSDGPIPSVKQWSILTIFVSLGNRVCSCSPQHCRARNRSLSHTTQNSSYQLHVHSRRRNARLGFSSAIRLHPHTRHFHGHLGLGQIHWPSLRLSQTRWMV